MGQASIRESPPTPESQPRWDLVLPHREQALRVARARTQSLADAEDLVSEAIIRTATVPDLREETVAGLLATVVMRLSIDAHRRQVSARRVEGRMSTDAIAHDLSERVCDYHEAAWLAGQVDGLNENEREVLLHRAAGHTVTSAAVELGMTYKAVESAYTRARTKMRLAWSGTLGVVIWLAGGSLKIFRKTQPAFPIAATVIAASAILILPPPERGDFRVPTVTDDGSIGSSQAATHLPSGRVTARGGASRAGSPASRVRSGGNGRSATTVLDTHRMGSKHLVETGARVEQRHADETTQETLERCVKEGVTVSLSKIDCNPST